MRSDEVTRGIREACYIGSTNYPEYSDARLMREATERLRTVFSDIVVTARNGYWLKYANYTATPGLGRYRIPPRAIVGGLERVWLAAPGSSDYSPIDEVPASNAEAYRGSTSGPYVYAWVGDEVDILPAPTTAIGIKVGYYLRPSNLVTQQSSTSGGGTVRGRIDDVQAGIRQVIVNAIPFDMLASTPSAIASGGQKVDIVRANGWHEVVVASLTQTYSGFSVTLGGTDTLTSVQVGDYLRAEKQTDWPQLPEDFHQSLCDATAVKVLLQMKLSDKANELAEVNNGDLRRFRQMLLPRTKADPKYIPIIPKAARTYYRGGGF